MPRRTTIEIDEDLLRRARQALGATTTRATVEEALRRAAAGAEGEKADRVQRQRDYLDQLGNRIDLGVLGSEDMWR